jgi:hypothetical protein
MLIHLLILGVTLGFSAAYNIDVAGWYDSSASYLAAAQVGICIQALVGGCLFILLAMIMAQMNAYSLMLPLARFVLEISLLAVSLLSFGALYFSWVLLKNAWLDLGIAAATPFFGVVAATFALYLFDFNYPYKQKILGYLILTVCSVVLVFLRVM